MRTHETQRDYWRIMETNWRLMRLIETTGDSLESYWRPMGHIETQRDYWILMRLRETQWRLMRLTDYW